MKYCKVWREDVVIPTYEIGNPEKNPIFLENRVYQGSSGVVYPYPVIESVSDQKTDHTYHAVFLENEYLKVMILPELGGRVQMAYDKIKQRHFIYYNQVIKPALVGLAGPWISGGIEFNWPQHHRPSTFMPVDCTIEEGDDYVTVWVNERERMFHQQGQAGFTLRNGCAYLEIQGKVYNPTEVPQTFLWWANPAVAVNDYYQSVFPPDVNAVFDHGKRAVSTFPIATGTYYKIDYSRGVDISNYKNIPVPTSYMIAKSKYDFEGGYENDTHAGMLHVADHHVSPGKKQWTWGNGDFGRAWDRNLTDEDGPYIELMAGVFTENQPDFTWLMPYEEKEFVQYFMPYRELGIVKQANKDFLINITDDGMMIYATSAQEVRIVATGANGLVLIDEAAEINPENIYQSAAQGIKSVSLYKDGRLVLSYEEEQSNQPVPPAAEAALKPEEIKTNEQLFLTGLHLEQYRHATWCALDYYTEALRRDPDDVRCNNAVGLWYLRRGRFELAEPYFRKAVAVLQRRNLNPYDGEPIYNLALCLKYQGHIDEAFDWAYKSTWNAAWQCAGFLMCAQIETARGEYEKALILIDKSLIYGWHNHKARALKMSLLKKCNRTAEEIKSFADESLKINPFNYAIMLEMGDADRMKQLMRHDVNNYDELALDYVAAGLNERALQVWQTAIEEQAANALTYYYIAWLTGKKEDSDIAKAQPLDYVFPNRLEAVQALSAFPDDLHANYLLGNLFYDKRQYDMAKQCWEKASSMPIPVVHRNLALLYYNKENDSAHALAEMEKAFALDESDSRIFMELDQLYKKLQRPHTERLLRFEQHKNLISQRDDLLLEYITLLNFTGNYQKAKDLLDRHLFHPWEGGEGKVPAQYQLSRIALAVSSTDIDWENTLTECLSYPHNLGEGKLHNAQDNDFYYLLGCLYARDGKMERAKECWQKGTVGSTTPAAALYYNDAKPDKIYYAGMCYLKLGEKEKANEIFHKLIDFGKQHISDNVKMDYFAVSLPDLQVWDGDLNQMNQIHCQFMLALGYAGLGDKDRSIEHLNNALSMDINHLGIKEFKLISSEF